MKKGFTLIEVVVMVTILLIFVTVIVAAVNSTSDVPAQTQEVFLPAPTAYAIDTAGVLSLPDLASLNEKLRAIAQRGNGKEIAVLVVPTTQPYDITQYGIMVGDTWKVGDDEKDNGVIIIIATEDREVRIEVGSGAEADITDAQAGDILDDVMIPYLKDGLNWYGALNAGIDAVDSKLN